MKIFLFAIANVCLGPKTICKAVVVGVTIALLRNAFEGCTEMMQRITARKSLENMTNLIVH